MAIVPVGSVPLFTFAHDGTMAWLRASGARLLAVDSRTGHVLREVNLDPAPFGLTWHVERYGGVFVVRDDREIAAYDEAGGTRLWKRTSPTKVAIVGETDGGKHISVAPGLDGIDVFETDLRTGEFVPRARVPGTMQWIGANALLEDGTVFFATDQREVFAIDRDFTVKRRHELFGSRILPLVATKTGVHVAVVEERSTGAVTKITTLDRRTAAIISTHELPGYAYGISVGSSGLVLDVRRSKTDAPERIAYRPDAPHVRLVAPRQVDLAVMRDLKKMVGSEPPPAVEILPPERPRRAREEMVPPVREVPLGVRDGSPGDGLRQLMAMLEADSDTLSRLARDFEDASHAKECLWRLRLTVRDPRVRWNSRPGRDPCLIDLAEDGAGNAIATYMYPPAKTGRVVVIGVPHDGGPATWLGDDFDTWLSGFFFEAAATAPEVVSMALKELGLPKDFARESVTVIPPRWFFEAHRTTFEIDAADAALAAGDIEGAERMFVSAAMRDANAVAYAKSKLMKIYDDLRWIHQRTMVTETW